MKTSIIPIVIEQHAEEAAFLWLQRDAAVRAPHYRLKHLGRLDERVEAHIDGLRVAGEEAWVLCELALTEGGAGEVFAAGVLALEAKDPARIEKVCAAAEATPDCGRGLVSAFGWVAPRQLQGTVRDLLASPSAFKRRLAIAACAAHRVNPGGALDAAVVDADATLRARALRAAGELGRRDLLPRLIEQIKSEDDGCRFWAAWSTVLLGDRGRGLDYLKGVTATGGKYRGRDLPIILRAMDNASAGEMLKGLAQYPGYLRDVAIGAGITGDPLYLPWLIKQMETPELMRVAGEAVSMITGLDLAYEDLEGKKPEGYEPGPTEDPEDEEVAMDPDEDLPWPDPKLVGTWWETHKGRFQVGTRYLLGKPVTESHCSHVLAHGYQRQRIAAALYLCLLKPGTPLFNTVAPAWRQDAALRSAMESSVGLG